MLQAGDLVYNDGPWLVLVSQEDHTEWDCDAGRICIGNFTVLAIRLKTKPYAAKYGDFLGDLNWRIQRNQKPS